MKRTILALFCTLAAGALAVFCTGLVSPTAQADDARAKANTRLGWGVHCSALRSREVDPIVYPGKVGEAHMHDPFGQQLDPNMTYAKLRNDPSNCRFRNGTRVDDRSAYWTPALYGKNGHKASVRFTNVYYRLKNGRYLNPDKVEPFTRGLKIIAGDMHATKPQMQPDGFQKGQPIVQWKCFIPGKTSRPGNLPADCGNEQRVAVTVTFPDCAKPGVADSADHKSHMAYSNYNRCPASHPKQVMQVNLFIVYNLHNGKGAYLSSNHQMPRTAYGMHADFFDAWGVSEIKRLLRNCVYSGSGCEKAGYSGA